jgi:predicted ATP-binding protein involved in virulence
MKIKGIHFEYYRGFENLEVRFPADAQSIVFIGENGSGKTSLLDATSILLQWAFWQKPLFPIIEETPNYDYSQRNPDIHNLATTATIELDIEHDEQQFLVLQNIDTSMSPVHPSEPRRFQYLMNQESFLILHYTAQKINLDSFKEASPTAFRIPMTTEFNLISDWFIEHENAENHKRLRIDTNYRSPELEIVRKVMLEGLSLLNGNAGSFSELQTEVDDTVKDGQVVSWLSIKKNGVRLKVNQLSDGEKRVIILLIDIARRLITVAKKNNKTDFLNGHGIVLIDEIEQHLHPKWQRMLLPTLNTIFPNIQFIVTTHSPQVISYVKNGGVFTLANGQAYPQNTYGRDNEWLLEEVMQDVNRPKEVEAQLNTYFQYIREGELAIAQLLRQELETLIGEDEPEFIKADILIRRKQKSATQHEAN